MAAAVWASVIATGWALASRRPEPRARPIGASLALALTAVSWLLPVIRQQSAAWGLTGAATWSVGILTAVVMVVVAAVRPLRRADPWTQAMVSVAPLSGIVEVCLGGTYADSTH